MAPVERIASIQVLEETPPRATRFLAGLSAVPVVRTLLAQAGMTNEDVEEGKSLLLECLAAPPSPVAPGEDTADAKSRREAAAEINQKDESIFGLVGASLLYRHPNVHAYVFDHLAPAREDSQAVGGMATLLARIEALEAGTNPARADSREDDAKAVQLLERRGFSKAARGALRASVELALGATDPLAALPFVDVDARLDRLEALRRWFEEWSAVARVVVKKRAYLIRLGLASRKVAKAPKPAA